MCSLCVYKSFLRGRGGGRVSFFRNIHTLIDDMEAKLEMISKWLRDLGMVVNESKTEDCLLHKHDPPTIQVTLNNTIIKSKKLMNVLGVTFDYKLNWNSSVISYFV